MKVYKGSFSVEAVCVVPLVILCMGLAIELGINLQEEMKEQITKQEEQEEINIIKCMYRRELLADIMGELYED